MVLEYLRRIKFQIRFFCFLQDKRPSTFLWEKRTRLALPLHTYILCDLLHLVVVLTQKWEKPPTFSSNRVKASLRSAGNPIQSSTAGLRSAPFALPRIYSCRQINSLWVHPATLPPSIAEQSQKSPKTGRCAFFYAAEIRKPWKTLCTKERTMPTRIKNYGLSWNTPSQRST